MSWEHIFLHIFVGCVISTWMNHTHFLYTKWFESTWTHFNFCLKYRQIAQPLEWNLSETKYKPDSNLDDYCHMKKELCFVYNVIKTFTSFDLRVIYVTKTPCISSCFVEMFYLFSVNSKKKPTSNSKTITILHAKCIHFFSNDDCKIDSAQFPYSDAQLNSIKIGLEIEA